MIDRELQARCRELLNQHEDLIKLLAEEEEREMARDNIGGDTAFEIAKKTIMNQGIKEGMKRLQARIYKHAKES